VRNWFQNLHCKFHLYRYIKADFGDDDQLAAFVQTAEVPKPAEGEGTITAEGADPEGADADGSGNPEAGLYKPNPAVQAESS
jgi:hypothetical protein